MHSLGIAQWNFTRLDHPGNPGRVSGSGPVSCLIKNIANKTQWDKTLTKGKIVQYTNIFNNYPPNNDIILHSEDILPDAYQSGV